MDIIGLFRRIVGQCPPDIQVGDLVEVTKNSSCCDSDTAAGFFFIVGEIDILTGRCVRCGQWSTTRRALVQASPFKGVGDSFAVDRLTLLKRQTNPIVLEQLQLNQQGAIPA
jgi:hypothetical protein